MASRKKNTSFLLKVEIRTYNLNVNRWIWSTLNVVRSRLKYELIVNWKLDFNCLTPNNIEMCWCSCSLSCTLWNQIEIEPILMCNCMIDDRSWYGIVQLNGILSKKSRTATFFHNNHCPFRSTNHLSKIKTRWFHDKLTHNLLELC